MCLDLNSNCKALLSTPRYIHFSVPEYPVADIVKEALEGYASGRFDMQAEVLRFLESKPEFTGSKKGKVTHSMVSLMLSYSLYAGYITHEPWGLNWIKAKHDPLISVETYENIQKRKEGVRQAPARKDINQDFVLRGFVECGDCNQVLTSCWSKGKRKKYPYYFCFTKGCESYKKSIPRAKIEEGFSEIVRTLQPTKKLFDLAKAMFKYAWEQRALQAESSQEKIEQDIESNGKQIEGLLDRIIDTSNTSVITAYENKIEKLESNQRVLYEKLQKKATQSGAMEEFFEHAMQFLANPWKLWEKGDFMMKKVVLRLAFSERIAYCRENGFRTPETALPFKVLEGFSGVTKGMVGRIGFEPMTNGLKVHCSTS